jgi:hypothetical protein
MLAKIEAKVAPPERKCLRVIVHEGDDEAAAMEKALAEHVASHPEDAGRTVRDFRWIVDLIVRHPQLSGRSILHPVALLLLPALSKSILLVASNSGQLTNSMLGVCSGVIVSSAQHLPVIQLHRRANK